MTMVALITGASAGIGEATARRLAREPGVALVLVARRQARLRALAEELGGATVIAEDLVDPEAPARIASRVRDTYGALHLLVNNAGASWRADFADGGADNVMRHLAVDFAAPVRLTGALLELLHETAARPPDAAPPAGASARPVAIVNVASAGVWAGRPGAGGYTAAKAALVGWSDSLRVEEARRGVHVGVVLPGFVATEGFPAAELRARAHTRWLVSRPEVTAEAVLEVAGWGGHPPRAERHTPAGYRALLVLRALAPGLLCRGIAGGALTTTTRPGG